MENSSPDLDMIDDINPAKAKPQGSQTLLRGLDMLDQVIDGPVSLAELSARIELTRSTTYRLAAALIDRGFLTFLPREGYQLGPKLLRLGFLAQAQVDIVHTAHPHLEALALGSDDTVHLGRIDDGRALYLDKISGRRRVEVSSLVGDRQPLTSTGLGKALLLDTHPDDWQRIFLREQPGEDYDSWQARMRSYVAAGRAFDIEENEDQIRCIAAPVRDASGAIVAAISVSSAAQYMDDDRMRTLSDDVRRTARAISMDLGWQDDMVPPHIRQPAHR